MDYHGFKKMPLKRTCPDNSRNSGRTIIRLTWDKWIWFCFLEYSLAKLPTSKIKPFLSPMKWKNRKSLMDFWFIFSNRQQFIKELGEPWKWKWIFHHDLSDSFPSNEGVLFDGGGLKFEILADPEGTREELEQSVFLIFSP